MTGIEKRIEWYESLPDTQKQQGILDIIAAYRAEKERADKAEEEVRALCELLLRPNKTIERVRRETILAVKVKSKAGVTTERKTLYWIEEPVLDAIAEGGDE